MPRPKTGSESPEGVVDLGGTWQLLSADGAHSAPMNVPGDGVSALAAAGLIPEPYFGRNEYDCRWVGETDWVLSREFIGNPDTPVLEIAGLDTVAEVLVNGQSILFGANAFRSYRCDIGDAVRKGKNRIEIRFTSPVKAAELLQARQPFRVPYHEGNSPIANGNMLRKPQCDFGWDWNIALAPFGLNDHVRMVPRSAVAMTDVRLTQTHLGDGNVVIDIVVATPGLADGTKVDFQVARNRKRSTVESGRAAASVVLEKPDLWWPSGLGAQSLTDVVITSGASRVTRRIGICDISLVSNEDAAGRSFLVRVNGQDVFCRGANWIPADALSGRIDRAHVRDLLQSAVDANMNMIRVWGGGRYEPDWFYDMCDELGLMVWQDFMFACNLYPSTPDFLAEVEQEVRETVRRLHHHPCIALWCGDNELVGALTWFEESRNDRDRYLVSYDRLNRTIESALKEELPDASWWPSSPSTGPLSFGDAWHDDSSGDMHFWSVWHEGKDFEHYRDVSPRFCSEFGFQSYPSLDVIRKFAYPEDMNIASPVMESHQKNAGGNARIAETMFRYFRFPASFADFVYVSQVQQSLAIKTAVNHWRSLKPHCMGTLYWQLNDTWPVCSWSSLDHGGGWKLLHHAARRFFAPVTVVLVPRDGGFDFVGVNDGPGVVDLTLEAFAFSPSGKTRGLGTASARISPDAAAPVHFTDASKLRENEMIGWRWRCDDDVTGEDFFAPRPFKSYDLEAPRMSVAVEADSSDHSIRLTSRKPAFFVSVESTTEGRFSDNGFLLLPGQEKTVRFTPGAAADQPEFVIRDLYSATSGGG